MYDQSMLKHPFYQKSTKQTSGRERVRPPLEGVKKLERLSRSWSSFRLPVGEMLDWLAREEPRGFD